MRIQATARSKRDFVRSALNWLAAWRVRRTRNAHLEGRVRVHGFPLLDVRDGCELTIGANVLLNSLNTGYHINMHSPVKITLDRRGAKVRIGQGTRLHGVCIHAYESITIGARCLIAANSHIIDGNGHDLSFDDVCNRVNTCGSSRPVVIEDDVWIAANCIILPGVRIGRGAVVGANSVVVDDVPPMKLVAGNPARVVSRRRTSVLGGQEPYA